MKRLVLAGFVGFVSWALLDALAHRLLLQSLYETTPDLWRPFNEMSIALVNGVTLILVLVFVTAYKALVRPQSLFAGLCLGGLLGVGLGVSSGATEHIGSRSAPRTQRSNSGLQ